MRGRSAQLCAVPVVRYERPLRVLAGGVDRARFAQRCAQRVHAVCRPNDHREADRHRRADQCAPGVRRSVQVTYMPLLSTADQERLRQSFAEIQRPVRLLFFTQTLDCATCLQTRQILDELPPLSDKITIEEINLILDRDRAREYGIDRVPAVAVAYEEAGAFKDSRIRFLGAPAGYEFISLVQAILLVGGRESILSA